MTAKRKARKPAIPPTLRRLEKLVMRWYQCPAVVEILATRRTDLVLACAAHAAYLAKHAKQAKQRRGK